MIFYRHVNIGPQYQADLALVAGKLDMYHIYEWMYFCDVFAIVSWPVSRSECINTALCVGERPAESEALSGVWRYGCRKAKLQTKVLTWHRKLWIETLLWTANSQRKGVPDSWSSCSKTTRTKTCRHGKQRTIWSQMNVSYKMEYTGCSRKNAQSLPCN